MYGLQEQKQFYEQIQKDKEDSASTFLDVARIVVEKELQTTEEQPDQHNLDDQYQQTNDQQIDQDQQHIDQGQQNDQDQNDQQNNDQDQRVHNKDNYQGQQLIDQSQSQQNINDQTNINNELTEKTITTAENQDEVPTDNQIVTSQSEAPMQTADTPHTSDVKITEKTNTEEVDQVVTVQHKEVEDDSKKQKDEITDLSSTQNIATGNDDQDADTRPELPEPTTQDITPQESTTQDSNSQQTLLQGDINGAEPTTESKNRSDEVAELSIANLAAHDVANPPLIERTDTQQTLTTVTMLDNPIRLEQLSRSSLDTDHSRRHKHQQIVQTISTIAVSGDAKPNDDDVIAISGMIDTGAVKSSTSSSTLSNVTDLTE